MSRRDVELARQISAVARDQRFPADPSAVQTVLIVPGAPDTPAVMPFWRAVLGYEPRGDSPDEDLVDPRSRGPAFWLEAMDEPRQGAARSTSPSGCRTSRLRPALPLRSPPADTSSAITAGVVDPGRRRGQRGRRGYHDRPRLTNGAIAPPITWLDKHYFEPVQ